MLTDVHLWTVKPSIVCAHCGQADQPGLEHELATKPAHPLSSICLVCVKNICDTLRRQFIAARDKN